MTDPSNGYEAVALQFAASRGRRAVGMSSVQSWAARFPFGAAILDLGCGTGVPIAQLLTAAGLQVFGVDASPSMVRLFRSNVPGATVACETVETSRLFERLFDGVIAWGLLFLLPPDVQTALISRVARAMNPGASFLFTAPAAPCRWDDVMTGRTSVSLGAEIYARTLAEAGLTLLREYDDEGSNHYYESELR